MLRTVPNRFWLLLCLSLGVITSVFAQEEKTYVLDAEDVVAINVLGHANLSGDYLIPESGVILVPVVGEVKVAGLSLTQVRDIVTQGLKVRLLRPEVSVILRTPRPKRVYVFGDVRSPGMVSMTPGWRILEALSAAGGLAAGLQAEDARVTLESKGGERQTFLLSEILSAPLDKQPLLSPGDVLRISSEYQVQVFVTGLVKSPSFYNIRQSRAGILEAITQAGGLVEGADLRSVKVIRANGEELRVDLTGAMLRGEAEGLPRLGAGDVVIVTQSVDRVWILGYVARPGAFPLPQNETLTISQVLTLAGGSAVRGRLSRVGLIRTENGKETRTVYDVGRFLLKGDGSQNPVVKPGDIVYVPETDRVDVSTVLGAIGAARLIFGLF